MASPQLHLKIIESENQIVFNLIRRVDLAMSDEAPSARSLDVTICSYRMAKWDGQPQTKAQWRGTIMMIFGAHKLEDGTKLKAQIETANTAAANRDNSVTAALHLQSSVSAQMQSDFAHKLDDGSNHPAYTYWRALNGKGTESETFASQIYPQGAAQGRPHRRRVRRARQRVRQGRRRDRQRRQRARGRPLQAGARVPVQVAAAPQHQGR